MKLLKALEMFEARGRLIGLNVGEKFIGVAVSDLENKIASPLSVLVRTNDVGSTASDLKSMISKYSLKGLVIGIPFGVSSDAVQVRSFVENLRATNMLKGLGYTFWNKSFATQDVELLLKPLNLDPTLQSKMKDKFAAVGILQGYLDYANKNSKPKTS